MTSDDLPAYADMHGRAEVARYLYWEPRGPEEARASLERKAANADPSEFVLAAVRNSDAAFVGEVNLHIYDAGNRAAEIGFIFHPQHHGHGYATEAAAGLLRIAFGDLGLHRVIGRCDARNGASAGVMRRLGMRQEAHFRQNEFVKGEWCDELVFALLDEEIPSPAGGE